MRTFPLVSVPHGPRRSCRKAAMRVFVGFCRAEPGVSGCHAHPSSGPRPAPTAGLPHGGFQMPTGYTRGISPSELGTIQGGKDAQMLPAARCLVSLLTIGKNLNLETEEPFLEGEASGGAKPRNPRSFVGALSERSCVCDNSPEIWNFLAQCAEVVNTKTKRPLWLGNILNRLSRSKCSEPKVTPDSSTLLLTSSDNSKEAGGCGREHSVSGKGQWGVQMCVQGRPRALGEKQNKTHAPWFRNVSMG